MGAGSVLRLTTSCVPEVWEKKLQETKPYGKPATNTGLDSGVTQRTAGRKLHTLAHFIMENQTKPHWFVSIVSVCYSFT